MKTKKSVTEKDIEIMRLALNLSGVSCNGYAAEIIVRVCEGIRKKGDQFSLMDASRIEHEVKEKYEKREIVAQKTTKGLIADLTDEIKKLREQNQVRNTL